MAKDDDLVRLGEQAGTAYAAGRQFFVARLRAGIQWRSGTLGELSDWGEALEVVERAGWVLDRWSVSGDGGGGQFGFPVFRRGDGRSTEWQDRAPRRER